MILLDSVLQYMEIMLLFQVILTMIMVVIVVVLIFLLEAELLGLNKKNYWLVMLLIMTSLERVLQ